MKDPLVDVVSVSLVEFKSSIEAILSIGLNQGVFGTKPDGIARGDRSGTVHPPN
jgi:hypothetical protein